MADLVLDKDKTALLMVHFHFDSMGGSPQVKERGTVAKARTVLEAARKSGLKVIYVVVHFREGYPEVTVSNRTFGRRKASGVDSPRDPASIILPDVAPRADEPVVATRRVSAFMGSDLEMILKAQGIEVLVLQGYSTGASIMSAVRNGADMDYEIIVVEDGCADDDPTVHTVLMERVFPRMATVVSSQEFVAALSAR